MSKSWVERIEELDRERINYLVYELLGFASANEQLRGKTPNQVLDFFIGEEKEDEDA